MGKLKIIFFAVVLIAAVSCKVSEDGTTVEITVTDGLTGQPSAGATVNLYESPASASAGTARFSQTTNASGKAKITVAYISGYYITVQNGNKKNYYGGYIPIGIFQTQTDIDSSPVQTPAGVIGGVKFNDTNHDGVINTADIAPLPSFRITANANNTFSVKIY